MRMFDLAAGDADIRFSPYCWRIKLAAALKGQPIETIPWRFTEQDKLPEGCRTVPTLIDGDKIITDSFAIATHLETRFPDGPSLFGGPVGRAHARLINSWVDAVVGVALVPIVVFDVFAALAPADRDYFRTSREKRLGRTLEDTHAVREERIPAFRDALNPARITLRAQPWLGGETPSYADCILWARSISRCDLLTQDDPVFAWRERMLDLFGGLARNAPTI
jgi:glutathione S-transferase